MVAARGIMDKTLNDTIEGFFRGVVFILLDSVTSFFRIILSPRQAPSLLIRRVYRKDVQQVRPYVFLFLALFVLTVLSNFLFLTDHNFFGADAKSFKENLKSTFDKIIEDFDAQSLLPILITTIVGVSVLHVLANGLIRFFVASPFRRRFKVDAMFFVLGGQMFLLLLIPALLFGVDEIVNLLGRLLHIPKELDSRLFEAESFGALAIALVLGIWLLFMPFPFAYQIVKARRTNLPWWRNWTKKWIPTVALAVCIDLFFVASCYMTVMIYNSIGARKHTPFEIAYVNCVYTAGKEKDQLEVSVILNVTAPGIAKREDFHVYLAQWVNFSDRAATSLENDLGLVKDEVYYSVQQFDSMESDDTSARIITEPGKWRYLVLRSTIPKGTIPEDMGRYLPSDQRGAGMTCVVAHGDDKSNHKKGELEYIYHPSDQ